MIGGRRPLQGRKAGDRRVRVERPHAPYFRYTGPNQLVAREAASRPRSREGRAFARVRAFLLGRPLSNYEEIEERLPKKKALAIFSSDPISSSAYATEEILRVLVLAGTGALLLSLPIAAAIALLLAVVSTSYRQIGYAYPSGGGAYAVARANLGRLPSLVAAGSLLVDYVMTVAVSTASAVEQITSAVPELFDERILIAVASIVLITVGNLRGLRESGNLFAIPTYLFVGSALLMIALGTFRIVVLGEGGPPPSPLPGAPDPVEGLGLLLVLRAFASGSVALTGTEAIANGVPAFKPPEPVNAAKTLTAVAGLLAVLFIGITFVADSFGIVPLDEPVKQTVISQVAGTVYGDGSIGFYLFQAFTALILFLAANTSYNATSRGWRRSSPATGSCPASSCSRATGSPSSSGIVVLAVFATRCCWSLFGGDTHALIPLYSVGVFVSFTIGQSRHGAPLAQAAQLRAGDWRLGINGFGAVLTGIVAVMVTVAKAPESLIVALVIPILVAGMLFIHRQYRSSGEQLAVRDEGVLPGPHREERVVVPVPGINRAVVHAVNVGRSIAPSIQAVLVSDDAAQAAEVQARWSRQLPEVPLVVVESPYRALIGPLLAYLDVLDLAWPPDRAEPITFVVIPEYVARRWWERVLVQPVGQAAPIGAPRAPAYGGRQRALSTRRAGRQRAGRAID